MDVPSFSGFPWLGVVLCGLFCLTVAALTGSVAWVRRTTLRLPIDAPGRWNLLFGGLCLAFLVGTIAVGLPALAGAWLVLTPTLIAFTRRRDACVAEASRYLSGKGLANIVADVKAANRSHASPKSAARMSIRDQFALLFGRVRAAAVQGRTQPAGRKRTAAPIKSTSGFAFLKKDGTTAIELAETGDRRAQGTVVSEHVCNARDTLLKAIRTEATDVHIEPAGPGYAVRARVDGVLRDMGKLDGTAGKGMLSALKVIADMSIVETERPQEGAFAVVVGGDRHDISVASTPTTHGDTVVMRLRSASGGVLQGGLGGLGLRPPLLKQLREIVHRPYGLLLVVGPPDCGKTTTAYAALGEIDPQKRKIAAVEDSIEHRLDDVTQVAIDATADGPFASGLRAVLRQDPDVLFVGEIRDHDTAEIACQTALTGHLVFSTLQVHDAVAAITRLLDLSLEPTLVQTAITAVLGQRLARRLCPDCRVRCAPPEGLIKKFNLKRGAVKHIYQEKGCDRCGGTGFRGRIGIHELLVMNDEIRGLIRPGPSITDLKKTALQSGMLTLQVDGLLKVIQGETSVNEILRVTT